MPVVRAAAYRPGSVDLGLPASVLPLAHLVDLVDSSENEFTGSYLGNGTFRRSSAHDMQNRFQAKLAWGATPRGGYPIDRALAYLSETSALYSGVAAPHGPASDSPELKFQV